MHYASVYMAVYLITQVDAFYCLMCIKVHLNMQ